MQKSQGHAYVDIEHEILYKCMCIAIVAPHTVVVQFIIYGVHVFGISHKLGGKQGDCYDV
jgi:hypothetical protein